MCHLCPHVNQCCCGCSLVTGALIIAWAFLIVSVLSILFSTTMHSVYPKEREDIYSECGTACAGRYRNSLKCVENCYALTSALQTVSTYTTVFAIAYVIINITLFVGVFAAVPALLVVFVYSSTFVSVAYGVFVASVSVAHGVKLSIILINALLSLLYVLLVVYCCTVVYSLYRTMVTTSGERPSRGVGFVVSVCTLPPPPPPPPSSYSQHDKAGPYTQYPPPPYYPNVPPPQYHPTGLPQAPTSPPQVVTAPETQQDGWTFILGPSSAQSPHHLGVPPQYSFTTPVMSPTSSQQNPQMPR